VTVQLFASYADMLGAPTVELPLTPGTTVQDLVRRIRSLPGASSLPLAPRVAINRSFAGSDQLIEASDEVALIPPVAGG
jgi:molybdopterin converting factor small subunit